MAEEVPLRDLGLNDGALSGYKASIRAMVYAYRRSRILDLRHLKPPSGTLH